MHRIFPAPTAEVDPDEAYRAHRPGRSDRPWVLINMIASADGATRIGGTSGGLGEAADRMVFRTLRAIADVILVGAGTVRAERYGPPADDAATRRRRAAHGSTPVATIAVVTGTLDLDLASPLFTDPQLHPIVITHRAADHGRRAEVQACADVVLTGGDRVDLPEALRELSQRGFGTLLCEGGPSLNGQMIALGLVDELCLSIAPLLVGGESVRIAAGPAALPPTSLQLDQVLTDDDYLFLRYTVERPHQ